MTASPSPEKNDSGFRKVSPGTRLTWRVVVGAIQDSAERSGLVAALSAAGFSIEDFGRLLGPRETACDWLTRYEDRLEARHGTRMAAERLAVKTVRRRLESELFR